MLAATFRPKGSNLILIFIPLICLSQVAASATKGRCIPTASAFDRGKDLLHRVFDTTPVVNKTAPVNSAMPLSSNAQQAAASNDFKPAIEELSSLILANPKNIYALTNRANFYFKSGLPSKALVDAKAALSLNGQNFNAVFIAGSALIQMRQTDAAIRYFDTALVLKPGWLQALQYRAKLLLQSNRNAEAIADLNKVIEMDPKNAMNFLLRARAHYRKYLINESLMDYIAVTNMAPQGSSLYELAKKEFQLPLLEYEQREAFMKEVANKSQAKPNQSLQLKQVYFEKSHPLSAQAATLGIEVNVAKRSGSLSQLDKARNLLLTNLKLQHDLNKATFEALQKLNNPDDKPMLTMLDDFIKSKDKMMDLVKNMKPDVVISYESSSASNYSYDYDEYDYWY